MYLLTSTATNCLFSGDHLFIAGCGMVPHHHCHDTTSIIGAVFEGSYSDMIHSLDKVKYLNPSTLIFPGTD